MLLVGLQGFLLVLFKILILIFQQNTVEACPGTVITACNDTSSCIQTYEKVYKLLGSHQNYFNIAQALYPKKWLPSRLVHVTLYGANGTENCRPAKYTWSISCMFAAFPDNVLEVLSLGSILVIPRTNNLSITINPFCCNVSQEDRMTMIDTVLAGLQDLAVSPGIQDPSLNTAECVIKGHEPRLTDEKRSGYIIATVWLSLSFSLFLGLWSAIYVLIYFDNVKHNIPAIYRALKWVSSFMLILEVVLFFSALGLSGASTARLKWHIIPVLIITLLGGPVAGIVLFYMKIPQLKHCRSWKLQIFVFMMAYLTSYHFCWIVIGILVNALWSVTVLLFVCVIITVLFVSLCNFFLYCGDSDHQIGNLLFCLTVCIPVLSLVAIVFVAGQTVFGGNTTDEVVRTVFLSFTIALVKRILSTMNTDDTSKKCARTENGGDGESLPLTSRGNNDQACRNTNNGD